ncbi:MAG: ABC transporter permease [Elusimicrobiales bacterium]|nr:ABC transporter permease [Elusimicrobiales bacterium]
MSSRFERKVAFKYLRNARKGLFTSVTTVIAVTGITLSIAAIFITLSILNGFQSDIKQKILDAQSHIIIYGDIYQKDFVTIDQKLSEIKDIKGMSPFIISQGILLSQSRTGGAVIKGIEKEKEFAVTNIEKSLKYGDWKLSASDMVIGEELAKNLGVYVGDSVVLVSPKFSEITTGIIPRMKKFNITGIINTGYYEYDSSFAFINISDARGFFDSNLLANGISIKLDDINKTFDVYKEIRERIPFYFSLKTYADLNKNLFSALKLEKFVMTLILSLIILIATFTISSNLFMITVLKSKEIGILRAMGTSSQKIKKIFFICGTYISVIGIALGMIIGYIALWVVKNYKIIELPSDIYYITRVPVRIELYDIVLIIVVALVLTFISSIYPAKKASDIDPVDAIRYG